MTGAKPQVMLLGTYHMANPGRDYANLVADDHLAPRRQAEIEDAVARLARFEPTCVAVETVPERQNELDRAYAEYRRGERQLTVNETEQIGFRLARRLGLARVVAVDHPGSMDFPAVFGWAGAHGQGALIDRLLREIEQYVAGLQDRLEAASVGEMLLELNGAEAERMHGHYLVIATICGGGEHPGAEMVACWYERNLKIFANIAQLAGSADDRILAIFGSGHIPLLRAFVRGCPDLDLVPVEGFLAG